MLKNLETMFNNAFGKPISQVIPLKEGLVPIEGSVESSLMFGSPVAAKEQFLLQSDIDRFLTSCPEGYFLVGFWGHGINSCAFYYSRVDAWSRVFFRLPFGGVYTDNNAMADHILKFLTGFIYYEIKLKEAGVSFIATESMHRGYYKIAMPGNNIFELKESLLASPNFDEKFGEFLNGNK